MSRPYFGKYSIGFFLKFHIRIDDQWKVCNVVFSFDLMKKCESDKTLKTNENLRNIRPPVQALSPKVYVGSVIIHPYTDKAYIEGVLRRVLDQIGEKLSKLQTFENS